MILTDAAHCEAPSQENYVAVQPIAMATCLCGPNRRNEKLGLGLALPGGPGSAFCHQSEYHKARELIGASTGAVLVEEAELWGGGKGVKWECIRPPPFHQQKKLLGSDPKQCIDQLRQHTDDTQLSNYEQFYTKGFNIY